MNIVDGIKFFYRRRKWAFASVGHLPKLAKVGGSMLWHGRYSTRFPLFLKIDLTPMCNIHCATCIHAKKPGDGGLLDRQRFHTSQRMSLHDYKKIIDQVRGKTLSVVLHYLGDPFMYSELDEASLIAYEAGMRVHIGTNLSYVFSDERVDSIVNSGVTDLTVCIDGLTQELYQRTRVGGNIERVLDNLRRICRRRKELKSKRMHIEVQYIRFEHNRHEEEAVRKKVMEIGVDQFTAFGGFTTNYVNTDPNGGCYRGTVPHRRKRFGFPYCHWPYTSMVIRYDGGVIPCCYYRLGSQYADGIKPMTFGNVFEKGVEEIWNGKAMQHLRRQMFDGSTVSEKSYCYGCDRISEFECRKKYVVDPNNGGLIVLPDSTDTK